MYNKEEEEEVEEKNFFTDRINITIILIFKIRKSLLTMILLIIKIKTKKKEEKN